MTRYRIGPPKTAEEVVSNVGAAGCLWPDVELGAGEHLLCCDCWSPVTWLVPPSLTTRSLTSDPGSSDSAHKISLRLCEVDHNKV